MSGALPGWGPVLLRHAGGLLQMGAGAEVVAQRAPRGRPVYLATPYSKRVVDADGQFQPHLSMGCALEAAEVAVDLMRRGITALSPIVQAHLMVRAVVPGLAHPDPLDGAMWGDWCGPMLHACGAVHVPALAGWAESVGILDEVEQALLRQRQVFVEAHGLPKGRA